MEDEIETGDLVWLKSGSPAMTVNGWDYNDSAICIWFHEGKSNVVHLAKQALTKITPVENLVK